MRRRDPLAAHNERMKLAANSVNAVGLAVVALGVVRPLIDPAVAAGIVLVAHLVVALVMHGLAHYILGQLEIDA